MQAASVYSKGAFMAVDELKRMVDAAEGREAVDILFKNAQVVDVYGLRVVPGRVAVKDGVIVGVLFDPRDADVPDPAAAQVIDCGGRYLSPGFIDGHLHIESSNVRPSEYARMALARGTTTAIADSHEIANVAGLDGLSVLHRQVVPDAHADALAAADASVGIDDEMGAHGNESPWAG